MIAQENEGSMTESQSAFRLRDERLDRPDERAAPLGWSDAAAHAALRRMAVLDEILGRLRQEVLPANLIRAALSAMTSALAAEGAAILDVPFRVSGEHAGQAVRHHFGGDTAPVLKTVLSLLDRAVHKPIAAATADGREVLVCPCFARFNTPTVLALWRSAGSGAWSAEECGLVASATGIIQLALEHEAIQYELLRHTRTDLLTGLFNRTAFLEELERRIDRLERENLPGTLMIADLDQFADLNQRLGLEAGDAAIRAMTSLLRVTFRPADLIGRIGDDEFAVWLDGADYLAAAERAEALRRRGLQDLACTERSNLEGLSFSIGIGTRWAGSGEEIEALMYRVDRILCEVKQRGRGLWRVSQPVPD
jgi:diguanylate cyclase (GGDEF)-like protein